MPLFHHQRLVIFRFYILYKYCGLRRKSMSNIYSNVWVQRNGLSQVNGKILRLYCSVVWTTFNVVSNFAVRLVVCRKYIVLRHSERKTRRRIRRIYGFGIDRMFYESFRDLTVCLWKYYYQWRVVKIMTWYTLTYKVLIKYSQSTTFFLKIKTYFCKLLPIDHI